MNTNNTTATILNVLAEAIADAQRRLEQPEADSVQTNAPAAIENNTEGERKFELFNHPDFGTIQATVIDGKPYFRANAIMKAVGYHPTGQLFNDIPGRVKISAPSVSGSNVGMHSTVFIPESGVKFVVERRKVHELSNFSQWITNEVVPQMLHPDMNMPDKITQYPNESFMRCSHPSYGEVMAILLGDTVYYKASDLAYMVGYYSTKGATANLPGRIDLVAPSDGPCGRNKTAFIPAGGFNKMLENRKMLRAPATRPFIKWILEEIPQDIKAKKVVSIAS